MLKLVLLLTLMVVIAIGAGEVSTDAMQVGHAMQDNDARLVASYSAGTGE